MDLQGERHFSLEAGAEAAYAKVARPFTKRCHTAANLVSALRAATATAEANPSRTCALIVARGLSKTYSTAGDVVALQNLDFQIFDGEFVSVIGQSGCGKSTLLKVLGGLLPYRTGSVELNGKPLRGPSPDAATDAPTDSFTEQFIPACNDFDRASVVAKAQSMN